MGVTNSLLAEKKYKYNKKVKEQEAKQVYYMSMEFLVGTSLRNNLWNMGIEKDVREMLLKNGFDIEMLDKVCSAVNVPVIASGGAGNMQHFVDLFEAIPNIDAGLAASIFHFGEVAIKDLKNELKKNNIRVRL